MDETTFRDELARDGFTEVLVRDLAAGLTLAEHHHDWDARLLVLGGDMQLERAGRAERYAVGDSFEVLRGEPHAERHGPQGTQLLIGRRHVPA